MNTFTIELDDSISRPLEPRLAKIAPKACIDAASLARVLVEQFALHATPSVEEWILARARNERGLPSLWEAIAAAERTAARFEMRAELQLAEAVAAVIRKPNYK